MALAALVELLRVMAVASSVTDDEHEVEDDPQWPRPNMDLLFLVTWQ